MTQRLDWAVDGRDWPHHGASRFIDAAGLTWHIQEFGRGPPLLLIHGTAASTHSWRGLAPLLATTHSVVSLDLPGHAFSGPLPNGQVMSLDTTARSVGAVLKALGIAPAMAIGHSAGAAILVRMGRDGLLAPNCTIVSLNGALLPFGGGLGRLFLPFAKLLAANPITTSILSWRAANAAAVDRAIANTGSHLDPIGLELYGRLFRNRCHVAAALGMMANWDLDGVVGDIARLSQPLTLVACGGDLAVPAEAAFEVRDKAPAVSVKFVRTLGHLAHEERPDMIAELFSDAAKPTTVPAPA